MYAARGIVGSFLLVKAEREAAVFLQAESARELRRLQRCGLRKERCNLGDLTFDGESRSFAFMSPRRERELRFIGKILLLAKVQTIWLGEGDAV